MNGPEARAYGALGRVLSGHLREHVFDPIVADLQLEHAAARSRGRHVQAAWIRARGHANLLEALALVIALDVLQNARRGVCRFGVATTLAALLTFGLFLGLATLTRDAAPSEMASAMPRAPALATPLLEDIPAHATSVR